MSTYSVRGKEVELKDNHSYCHFYINKSNRKWAELFRLLSRFSFATYSCAEMSLLSSTLWLCAVSRLSAVDSCPWHCSIEKDSFVPSRRAHTLVPCLFVLSVKRSASRGSFQRLVVQHCSSTDCERSYTGVT